MSDYNFIERYEGMAGKERILRPNISYNVYGELHHIFNIAITHQKKLLEEVLGEKKSNL